MADPRAQRELNSGFSAAFGRGLELALTPAVFAGLGWLADSWLGTGLVFTIGLLIFSLVGMGVRAWLGYDQEMRRHEAQVPGLRMAQRRAREGRS